MTHEMEDVTKDIPLDLPGDSMESYNPGMTMLRATVVPETDKGSSSKVRSGVGPQLTSEGRYRLLKRIGKGGFGEVWQAEQVELGRMVAVKRLRKDILKKKDTDSGGSAKGFEVRSSFRQELLTAASLEHPNIVPVHDLGVDSDGELLMAMKQIHGTPWDQLLYRDGTDRSVSPVEFLQRHLPILAQLCQAVAYSHSRGVIHRDLKPTQVIVGEFGEVLLMDWGLALVYDRQTLTSGNECVPIDELPDLQTATAPAGTPAFMAPEQTEKSAQRIGPWTDVYLLAGTLYYLLTLQPPHGADTAKESFLKARLGYVVPPRERSHRWIPEELAQLCMQAMEPEIENRINSVHDFLQGLQDYLSGASKRRESQRITDEVRRNCLEEGCHHYDGFAGGLTKLAQAEALWQGNPSIESLRMDLQVAYAKTALDKGDLSLARLQTSHLDSGPIQKSLDGKIEAAEAKIHRKERQRRIMVVLTLTMLMVVALTSGIYNMRLAQERDDVASARDEAQGIVSFMIGDLADSMTNLEPLRRVAENVLAYYERFSDDQMSVEMRLQKIKAMENLGNVYSDMGDRQRAFDLYDRGLKAGTALLTEFPEYKSALEAVATSEVAKGKASFLLGDQKELPLSVASAMSKVLRFIVRNNLTVEGVSANEITQYVGNLETARNDGSPEDLEVAIDDAVAVIFRWQRDNPKWLLGLSELYVLKGNLELFDTRNYEAALKNNEKALAMRLLIPAIDEHAPDVYRAQIESELTLARTLLRLDRLKEAKTHFDSAREMAQKLDIDVSADSYLAVNMPFGWLAYGDYLAKTDDGEGAIRVIESSLQSMQIMSQNDPKNNRFRNDLLEGQRILGQTWSQLGNYSEASRNFSLALRLNNELLALQPNSLFLQTEKLEIISSYINAAEELDPEADRYFLERACRDLSKLQLRLAAGGNKEQNLARRILALCP